MSRDIVLIVLDSVRKDVFDEVAHRTQELSEVSFDNCRAASSWSIPSHASMISGELAHEHGIHTHSRSFDSLPMAATVFGELHEYRTVGISGNIYAGPAYEFDRYFDRFVTLRQDARFPEALDRQSVDESDRGTLGYLSACLAAERTLKSLCNGATQYVDSVTRGLGWAFDEGAKPGLRVARRELEDSDQPTFVFLNLMEGHIPYYPARYLDSEFYDCPRGWSSNEKGVWELFAEEYDDQYWERRNQLYRAVVDYLDRCIADFVRSVDEETTVVVTSDHGDNLGTQVDEGLANHKSSLSEGVLHVPLCIVNTPEIDRQTGQYLSQLAMPELIEGIRDGRIEDMSSDRAVAELGGMSAGPDPDEDYEYYDRAIRCAYDRDEKVVWDSLGNCTQYRVDPERACWQGLGGEPDRPPSWARDRFDIDISSFKRAAVDSKERVVVDDSTTERLKELGYL